MSKEERGFKCGRTVLTGGKKNSRGFLLQPHCAREAFLINTLVLYCSNEISANSLGLKAKMLGWMHSSIFSCYEKSCALRLLQCWQIRDAQALLFAVLITVPFIGREGEKKNMIRTGRVSEPPGLPEASPFAICSSHAHNRKGWFTPAINHIFRFAMPRFDVYLKVC